jgi:hypothetical protein
MSLFTKVSRFAKSPQGKKAMDKAKDFANKPETKEKIEDVRGKLSGKKDQPAADAPKSGQGSPGAEPASPGTKPATAAGGSEPTTPAAGGTPPINDPEAAAVGEQPAQGNPPTAP